MHYFRLAAYGSITLIIESAEFLFRDLGDIIKGVCCAKKDILGYITCTYAAPG